MADLAFTTGCAPGLGLGLEGIVGDVAGGLPLTLGQAQTAGRLGADAGSLL